MPSKLKATGTEQAVCGQNKYYMNFDFYFKRTSFRTMTLYFKLAFKPFFDAWKSDRKKTSVLTCLSAFTSTYFPGLLTRVDDSLCSEFLELLKMLVFSHRHNKNDAFLQDPLVDFAVVREPMYKYSRTA